MTEHAQPRWFSVLGTERDGNASIGDHTTLEAAIDQATRQSIYVKRTIRVMTDLGVRVGSAHDSVWSERDGWRDEHDEHIEEVA